MNSFISVLLLVSGFTLNFAQATINDIPPALPNNLQCLDTQHQSMNYNNAQVMVWEKSTPDQFLARGMVQGAITEVYSPKNGHTHFAIDLGNGGGIEVIYSDEFGALPSLRPGMSIVACGDYISVGKGAQLPSPMPAIIHWVHYNPGTRDGGRHASGFLLINGKAYGLTAPARN